MAKTTIIISDLTKPDLLKVSVTIKQYLITFQKQHNISENELVENWSELPTLSRLVIIFTKEEYTQEIYTHLKTSLPSNKIHLSESLLRRHKSFDSQLHAPSNLEQQQSLLYEEPKPMSTGVVKLQENQAPRTLFKPDLTLDTNQINIQGSLDPSSRERSPRSPTITLEECTKTTSI
ncbi:hypothetical protein BN7_3802 [Wickerhamomyces ciferrii]|uniref:Uncharacterized protein n=1 Tax=Wickerhamomyces ciferrii (strain ATCC 14091 / BCRC 22168 / CBS 111 / JCM 3599 / NBRC 0793 / NRRL Y-1031 F-60-10) TaxID=1206466 RepID=K0KMR1_WICCF|nr:uncharacterized protein BN7_3802 [Wickerhamomyces ciferrii]CCH44241.1 hypothetical protein BN7_3802 [Wickerhamomyces ciferrii]